MEQNWIEICGVVFGIGGVWLTIRQNIWCWPVGLVNIILYVYIFYQDRYYANTGLQTFFIFISIYGWWHWLHGGADKESKLLVSRLRWQHGLVLLLIGIAAAPLLGLVLEIKTDAATPYWDSTTAVMSLIAQWLMARKIFECWLVWIAVDTLYVGFFIYQNHLPTAGLYALFLILATLGFVEWKKSLQ